MHVCLKSVNPTLSTIKCTVLSALNLFQSVLSTIPKQNRLDAVDVDKAVEYVLRCMNFDGGFGRVPGSESHAGQVSHFERIHSIHTVHVPIACTHNTQHVHTVHVLIFHTNCVYLCAVCMCSVCIM